MRKTITIILVGMLLWLTLAGNILAQIPKMSLRPVPAHSDSKNNYNVALSTFTFLPPVKSKTPAILAASEIMSFNQDHWLKVKKNQERTKEVQDKLVAGIEFNLPYESKLNISGRKMINIKTGKVKYAHPDQKTITGTPSGVTDRLDMQQELQVKIKGKVGPKILVNIDYDDTKEDKRDISVIYKGDPDEVVQEAAFGDIDLTLPQTEFVSYNKKLFGGKIDTLPVSTENSKLRVMAIGSRTKGVTETKRFKGNTTFEKRELFDTQYIRRKYYKIYPVDSAAATDLPIASGSVEIYIDNRLGTDNNNAVIKNVRDSNGVVYNGYFEKQNAGIDYTVDYRTGVITFNKAIGSNYIIAVDYKRSDGTWLSSGTIIKLDTLRMIKDELETPITREMKNYYSLGSNKIINDPNKFIVKIMDLNRNELNSSSYSYEVDYDFGTIRFLADKPFDPDVYISIPNHHYIIYVEYRHSVKTYNLRPGLVQKSEKVKINGEELIRDEDYFIDYDIGLLTFLKEAAITDDTDIEVDYEYMPFGGQFQQTIVGARTEYEYSDKFTLGSTILYNWATSPGNIPNVRSTPESILVMEGDSKLKLRPGKLWKLNLEGLNIDLGAEVAQSKYNPDIFGKAMVDNMEGSEIADTFSTDKDLWRLGSLGQDQLLRGTLEWANGDEDKHTINENITEDGRDQTLDLTYTLPENNSWVSLVYPVSTVGVDYSKHNYLQFWVCGEGVGETLHVDLGRVSEDADGKGGFENDVPLEGPVRWPKGSPKTEDKNGNGLLDVGEDIGWEYVNSDGTKTKVGEGNGRLDSEDLDGDGILSTIENKVEFSTIITKAGWQQIRIPLVVDPSNLAIWQNIKHIRFWLTRGFETRRTIRISKMEIVGNCWDKPILSGTGTMDIVVKSNEDNSNISLKDNGDYRWLYRDTVNKDLDENSTLVLQYANFSTGSKGYTKRQLSKSLDFSKHRKMRFFVYGDGQGEMFSLQVGSNESNYYEYCQTIDWIGWQMISIDMPGEFTRLVGFPNLSNILMIRLGIIAQGAIGESEIWVDEIHLIEPNEEVGLAQKYSLDSTYKDLGTLSAKYRSVNDKFSMVGVPKVNQSITAHSIAGTLTKLHIKKVNLPTKFSWDKITAVTPTSFRTELSTQDEGRVITDNFNAQTTLTKDDLPQIGLSYSLNKTDSNLQQQLKKTYTYGSTLNYGNKPKIWKPLSLTLPDNLSSYYKRIHGFTYYDGSLKKNPGYEDLFEQTDDWSVNPTYIFQFKTKAVTKAPVASSVSSAKVATINTGVSGVKGAAAAADYINRLTLSPSYKRRKTAETKTFYDDFVFKRKKSDSQTVGLNSTVELFKWLNPTFKYNIITNETYNVNASSKQVNRSATTEVFNMMKMSDLWSWRPLDSLNINNRYKIDEGDIYDNADAVCPTMNKLWVKKQLGSGDLKSTNRLITFENTVRWLPFNFLNLKGGLRPIKTIDTTTKYTKTNEHRMTTGTPYDSFAKTFPDISVVIRELEKFPAMSVFLEASQLDLKYYLKTVDRVNISLTKEDFWETKWRGKLFKKYTLLLNMSQTKTKEIDPASITLRNALTSNKGSQVNFRTASNFIFILSYDDRKQSEKDRYGEIIRQEYTRTPAIKMEKDLAFPKGLRIPFTKKIWKLTNNVHLTTAFKTIMLRSNIAEKNNNTYSASTSVDYNVSYNFVVTLGMDGSMVKNKELDINDYYTYGANFKLLIRF